MRQVADLIGSERAAAASVVRPAKHARLEECPIHDQLLASLEQIEQAHFALRPFKLVRLLHRHPRHPTPLSRQCISRPREGLLLHEHLLTRSLPGLRRHGWRDTHRGLFAFRFFLRIHGFSPLPFSLSAVAVAGWQRKRTLLPTASLCFDFGWRS